MSSHSMPAAPASPAKASTSFADIDFERNQQDFIHALKSAMKDVEKFYNVEIPVEEIEYIYEYVKNDG